MVFHGEGFLLVARGTLPVMSGGHGQDDYATAADVAELLGWH
jgi:hypothetical protein